MKRTNILLLARSVFILGVAGCGGGGSEPNPPTPANFVNWSQMK